MNERIDVPQIVRADDNDRRHDRKMVTVRMYKPPLDGRKDEFKEFDMLLAGRIEAILTKEFPGYPWKAEADAFQGVVYFAIPILMGPTLKHVIRLAQWDHLSADLIRKGGGEILERFNLPRTKFEVSSFLHARDHRWLADVSTKKPIA